MAQERPGHSASAALRNEQRVVCHQPVPADLVVRCPQCQQLLLRKEWLKRLKVCGYCDHHFRLSAPERIGFVLDEASFCAMGRAVSASGMRHERTGEPQCRIEQSGKCAPVSADTAVQFGVVAYEMARQLHEQGERLGVLALVDSQLSPTSDASHDDEAELADFVEDIASLSGTRVPPSSGNPRKPVAHDSLEVILAQMGLSGARSPESAFPQVRHVLRAYRANSRALERYAPHAYPGRVTVFRPADELAAHETGSVAGWEHVAEEGANLHVIPGNHYSIPKPPNVQVLAARLACCFEQSERREG